MGPGLQPVGARFSNFFSRKGITTVHTSRNVDISRHSNGHIFRYCVNIQSHGYVGSPTRTVYIGVTLTRSKVKVNITGLLNFRQFAKPCMLAAITAAPLRGFWLNFHLGKLSREFKLRPISKIDEIQKAICRYCVTLQSRG